MTYKYIKKLAENSYKSFDLDQKSVEKIIKLLTKKELREYIKILKKLEQKKSIIIVIPNEKISKKSLSMQLKKIFPDRKIIYQTDPSLLLGIRIIDNDLIYELNLKDTLEQISTHIIKAYD